MFCPPCFSQLQRVLILNNPTLLPTILGTLIGIPFVFVIFCYASAVCLHGATKWLGFGRIQGSTAFKTAFTALFVTTMINFSIGLQFASIFSNRFISSGVRIDSFDAMRWAFSPMFTLISLGTSLALTALIFSRMLYRGESEKPLSFQDALTLSALHYAILSASIFLLVGSTVVFVYAVVSFMPFP